MSERYQRLLMYKDYSLQGPTNYSGILTLSEKGTGILAIVDLCFNDGEWETKEIYRFSPPDPQKNIYDKKNGIDYEWLRARSGSKVELSIFSSESNKISRIFSFRVTNPEGVIEEKIFPSILGNT